jgi:1-acyl-sn-glycerol-3-phosphate acyltransferase
VGPDRNQRSEVVDEFGHDPLSRGSGSSTPCLQGKRPWGTEHIPTEGRVLLCNHGGALPFDALMLKTAIRREHSAHRNIRWLAEDSAFYLPFVGSFMNRMGSVRACQENAERLLRRGHAVAVFPEGVKGTGRLYRDRYKLQRFGRGGFVRLAIRTQTPIVPCAVVGAEEAMPLLHRAEQVGKALDYPSSRSPPRLVVGCRRVIPAPPVGVLVCSHGDVDNLPRSCPRVLVMCRRARSGQFRRFWIAPSPHESRFGLRPTRDRPTLIDS